MKIDFKKDVLPHLIVVSAMILLVCFYFGPMVFGGKVLDATDLQSHRGTSYEVMEFMKDNPNEEQAFWTNTSFGGMAAYLINMDFSSGNYLSFLRYPLRHGGIPVLFIYGVLCMYVLLHSLRIHPIISGIGSLGYVFGSFNFVSIEAGHTSKIMAMFLAPLVLAGIVYIYEHKKWILGGIIVAASSSLEVLSGHYQITFYLFFVLLIYVIVQFVKYIQSGHITQFAKFSVILLVAGGLGVGTCVNKVVTVYEYSKETIRGKPDLITEKEKKEGTKKADGGLSKKYAFDWSYGKAETFTVLIPGYYGNASKWELDKKSSTYKALIQKNIPRDQAKNFIKNAPMYRGDVPFTSGTVYFGAIICFFFVFAMITLETEVVFWLVAGTAFSFFIAWGRNFPEFNYFLFDNIPGFNKFRAVSMAMYLGNFLVAAGAALGLQKILATENKNELLKPLFVATGIITSLILLVVIATGIDDMEGLVDGQVGWVAEFLQEDRLSLIKKDAFRSIALILIAAGLAWALIKNKLKAEIILGLIALISFIDLFTIDRQYVDNSNFTSKGYMEGIESQRTAADDFVLRDDSYYRVFNVTRSPFNDAITSYFHNSVGGYHPAKLKRYQDVIANHLSATKEQPMNREVLNMLNTKYIIQGKSAKEVYNNSADAYGNAWFVDKIAYVSSPNEEIETLRNKDLRTTAYMDQTNFKASNNSFALAEDAKITFTENKLNTISYSCQNSNDGFAVFSENYYPEWKAYVDGKEVDIKRVNYILRGIEIPKGNHKIEFKMNPVTYNDTKLISTISSIAIILLSIGGIAFMVKGSAASSNKEEE